MSANRRNFVKSLAVLPVASAAASSSVASTGSENVCGLGRDVRLSLNVYSFNTLLREGTIDLFDVIDFCAEHGFDAIDPTGYYFPGYPKVPDDRYINRFKRQAFLAGLDISGTGVRNDFANPDAASREADKTLIKAWIRVAAKLSSPNLRIFPGHHEHEGHSRDEVFNWMASDIKECCDFGRRYGVMIALQNHNGFLKTAADIERIFEMVDSGWLGLNLDIGSLRQGNPYDEIAKSVKYAVTWQAKENVWFDDARIATDFVELFRIIKASGYRGYLPLETLGAGDPYEKISALLSKVRQSALQVQQMGTNT